MTLIKFLDDQIGDSKDINMKSHKKLNLSLCRKNIKSSKLRYAAEDYEEDGDVVVKSSHNIRH